GFTAGIAVIIFTSQLKDLFGLAPAELPAEFLPQLAALWAARDTFDPATFAIAAGALAVILLLRRTLPNVPAFLVAVVGASLAVWALGLPVETIGSRFGAIPSSLPLPGLPELDLEKAVEVLPSAFTIAFLAGIESLLSAMVA